MAIHILWFDIFCSKNSYFRMIVNSLHEVSFLPNISYAKAYARAMAAQYMWGGKLLCDRLLLVLSDMESSRLQVIDMYKSLSKVADRYAVVDRYAVLVVKNETVTCILHLPQIVSKVCSIFLCWGSLIHCTITGNQCYSSLNFTYEIFNNGKSDLQYMYMYTYIHRRMQQTNLNPSLLLFSSAS